MALSCIKNIYKFIHIPCYSYDNTHNPKATVSNSRFSNFRRKNFAHHPNIIHVSKCTHKMSEGFVFRDFFGIFCASSSSWNRLRTGRVHIAIVTEQISQIRQKALCVTILSRSCDKMGLCMLIFAIHHCFRAAGIKFCVNNSKRVFFGSFGRNNEYVISSKSINYIFFYYEMFWFDMLALYNN